MFSDHSSEIVQFPSCWRSEKKLKEISTQTSGILTYEVASQTRRPCNVECQTESLLELMEASLFKNNHSTQNERELLQFLRTVEPTVSKQLKVNVAASNLYTGLFKQKFMDSEVALSCEYVLEEESMVSNQQSECTEVTSVSWSSSGATVAAAYGTNNDIAWSDSRSCLCLWNLDRPKLNRLSCDQKLELESSIQVVSFHPQFGGYIAAGLFSGVVLVWDLAKDEVSYSSSSHEDPVTCLSWLEEKDSKYLSLLSASTDGKLIVWRYKKGKVATPLEVDKQFEVRSANLSKRAGYRGTGAVGITCLSVGSDHLQGHLSSANLFSTTSTIAVGCEGGAVLKCNIDTSDSNPVIFTYEGHVGPVCSIDWSPFHRHLFLTCSTDQACHIYHSLHSSPIREIRPEEAVGGKDANYLFSAFWSPTRPLFLFAAGTRGIIEACDVSTSSSVTHSDVTNRNGDACVVNTMRMNERRRNMIVTGSSCGLVHVWRLGTQLVEPDDGAEEFDAINELANVVMGPD